MERIKKTSTIFFAIVIATGLLAVTLVPASQNASAEVLHHKVAAHHVGRTASKGTSSVRRKVIAVIPEVHGKTLNATALKKLVKGPYESIVIGGMIAGGY